MFGWFRKRRTSNRPESESSTLANAVNQLAYYRSHPPTCIAGFKAQAVNMPGVTFDGHASPSQLGKNALSVRIEGPEHINPVFWLRCDCGCDSHFILGHQWRNPDYGNVAVFLSPLALRCNKCGKTTELFDTAIHGYDAELCAFASSHRGEGERTEFICEKCGPRETQVFVRFEYPDDLLQSEFDKYRGREQDLFSWFSLIGKCAGCGRLIEVTDFECA
jgi:hypothetical protein